MSSDPTPDLIHPPLASEHASLGAKMAEFGGWLMPLEYTGAVKEHNAVRAAAGLFDVSHLGKAVVRGPGAADFVNRCFTNDLRKIGPGQAQYTMCCDESGGVVDDLIQYLRSDDEVFLIPNASNTGAVVDRLTEAAPDGITVVDQHADFAVLALQGPASDEVMTAVGLPVGHDYMSFVEATHGDAPVTVCRTGYTGERGYELVVPSSAAAALWRDLLTAGQPHGLVPAGLGARDTLRTEMGYPLHGQDLSPQITPVMGRSAWAVGWDKDEFWGRDALVQQRAEKTCRTLRGLVADGRGIPRAGMIVSNADGQPIGEVTSGTFSPTRKQGVALALLDRGNPEGSSVTIDVRGKAVGFTISKPPFVEPGVRA